MTFVCKVNFSLWRPALGTSGRSAVPVGSLLLPLSRLSYGDYFTRISLLCAEDTLRVFSTRMYMLAGITIADIASIIGP